MYALSSYLFNSKISEYLKKGQEPPARLPVVLSPSRADWDVYGEMLRELQLYPMPLENLRPFPGLQIRHNEIATKDHARLIKGEVVPEGLVLQFELGKGQYATTFLSHIFNLTSGLPLEGISKGRVDTKAVLGEPSLQPLLERFGSTIHAKGENMFETLLGEEGK
jgi:tRNA(Glu) U13 pseudouridine synthase TruD